MSFNANEVFEVIVYSDAERTVELFRCDHENLNPNDLRSLVDEINNYEDCDGWSVIEVVEIQAFITRDAVTA